MKILSKKNVRSALVMITALQVMVNRGAAEGRLEPEDAAETLSKCTEALAELAWIVGGLEGMNKVKNSVARWERTEEIYREAKENEDG